jgi:hypothetical protein
MGGKIVWYNALEHTTILIGLLLYWSGQRRWRAFSWDDFIIWKGIALEHPTYILMMGRG